MPARFFVEKRKDPDYIPNDPMEIEHVDEFLKLMAVLTGDNRYVDIVKLDGKEIVNMCDVATRLENLGIQKGLAAYQQHLREYKGKTTTAAPSPGEWEEAFGDADVIFCFTLASVDNFAKNGRVSHVIAKGIGLIGIQIVGTAGPEGTLDFKGKCRGDKKVLVLILEKMKELGYNGGRVIIAHNQNEAAALQLKMRIEELFGTFNGVIHPERALCCYYAEPGSVMVGFEA